MDDSGNEKGSFQSTHSGSHHGAIAITSPAYLQDPLREVFKTNQFYALYQRATEEYNGKTTSATNAIQNL